MRGLPAPDLRAALVRATVELLATHEPTEISLRAVARQLGVSSGAPYHHYDDKTALLADVALQGWLTLGTSLAASLGDGPAPDRLDRMGRAYLTFALAHPAHYRVMFLPELADDARYPELHAASHQGFELLSALLAEGLDRPADHPDVLARTVGCWSTVHGFAVLFHAGVLAPKVDALGLEALIGEVVGSARRAAFG